jgi:hypothetical protein
MSKTIIYIGEGGDVGGAEVMDELIEFADCKPIMVRPAHIDLDDEFKEEDNPFGSPELFIIAEHV